MAPSNLLTLDGEVPTFERNVTSISPAEMKMFRDLDALVTKLGSISLICNRCDHSFIGLNSGFGRVESIHCRCREIKAEVRSGLALPPL